MRGNHSTVVPPVFSVVVFYSVCDNKTYSGKLLKGRVSIWFPGFPRRTGPERREGPSQ